MAIDIVSRRLGPLNGCKRLDRENFEILAELVIEVNGQHTL